MEITIVLLSAITVGIVEAIKVNTNIPKALLPFLAIAVGIGTAVLGAEIIGILTWQEMVLTGMVMGLSAMGMYSGGKAVMTPEEDELG